MSSCKTGLVPLFKGEANRIVLEQALQKIELVVVSCSDCGKFHLQKVQEMCRVCKGPVLIIINRGTGLCCENCRKADVATSNSSTGDPLV